MLLFDIHDAIFEFFGLFRPNAVMANRPWIIFFLLAFALALAFCGLEIEAFLSPKNFGILFLRFWLGPRMFAKARRSLLSFWGCRFLRQLGESNWMDIAMI